MPVIRRAHWRGLTLIQCEPGGVLTAQTGPLVLSCWRSKLDGHWTVRFHLQDLPDTNAPPMSAGDKGDDLEHAIETAYARILRLQEDSRKLLDKATIELEALRGKAREKFNLEAELLPRKKPAPRKKKADLL